MRTRYRAGVLAGLLLAIACTDASTPTSPRSTDAAGSSIPTGGAAAITVYTQNLFVGADVDGVINALGTGDPQQAFAALAQAVVTLHHTDFPARAAAIAAEIARTRPHVVGLQEGSKIDIDLTPLGAPLVAHEDFLVTLRAALDAQGLTNYVIADSLANIEAHLLSGMVNLVDYDVMLIDEDRVTLTSTIKHHFTHNDGPIAGIDLIRGYIAARFTLGERPYVAVTTHTEGTDLTAYGLDYHVLHAQQMQDILDEVAEDTVPTVVMGDLNDDTGSLMYDLMLDAGFVNVWTSLRPGAEGNTCCRAPDLSATDTGVQRFPQRTDHIFVRGFDHEDHPVFGAIFRFGFLPSDRVNGQDGMIWPSDHAGLVAALRLPAE